MTLLFAVWALVVAACYYPKSYVHPQYLSYILDAWTSGSFWNSYTAQIFSAVLVAAWLGWIAYQSGNWILTRLLPETPFNTSERWALGGSLGFGFLTLCIWALGAARLWYTNVLWGVGLFLSLLFIFKYHTREWIKEKRGPETPAPWGAVWIIFISLFFLLFLLGELAPEIFYDALYYHIAVPNLYRIAHRIYSLPTMLFSNFVLTVQLIYGWALTLGTEISAKLLHGLMAAMLVACFVAFERRFFSKGAGWLAAVLFLGMPLVGINVITTGTDVGGSFFQLASAYALVCALTRPGRRWLVLAGLLTGISASCKYPAFPYIPIAGLLILWHRRWDEKQPWTPIVQELLLFWACAMVMIVPIFIRNIAFHANPLYPFGGTHWGTPLIDTHHWDIFISDANTRVLKREFQDAGTFFRFLFHPWFITMAGMSNADFIGPLVLTLLPLVFLLRAPSTAYRTLRRHTALLWILWMISTTTPRYGLPALVILALLLAEGLLTLVRDARWRPFFLGLVVVGSLNNLFWLMMLEFNNDGWRVVEGLVSRDDYLSEMHGTYPTPPYDGFRWMNDHLPEGSKILIAGDARSYYTRFSAVPSSVPDPQPLLEFSRQARDAAEMARLMREQHITHVFLNFAEAVRTEGYGLFPWDKTSWDVFSAFWTKYIRLSWKEERFVANNPKALYVFELLNDQQAAAPHSPPMNPFERWKPK